MNNSDKRENLTANFTNQLASQSAASFWESLGSQLSDAYCITDFEGSIVALNHAYAHALGYNMDDLLGKKFTGLLPDKMQPYALMLHQEYLLEQTHESAGEWNYQHRLGHLVYFRSVTTRLKVKGRRYKLDIVVVQDHKSSAKLAEEKNKIYHQVKNSLHEIGGLLHLEATFYQDQTRQVLSNVRSRVSLVAIAYEQLYRDQQACIDIGRYLQTAFSSSVTFNPEPADTYIFLPVDQAYALGILLHEYIAPASKVCGMLRLELTNQEGCFQVKIIGENRCALPEVRGFSQRLIHALLKQLQARVGTNAEEAMVTLSIPY